MYLIRCTIVPSLGYIHQCGQSRFRSRHGIENVTQRTPENVHDPLGLCSRRPGIRVHDALETVNTVGRHAIMLATTL
jgi:hypothetical protein